MIWNVIVVVILFVIYGLVIGGLTLALRKLGVPSKWAIAFGFLLFSIGAGLWATQIWPRDTVVMVNFPAVLFGDVLYGGSIRYLGDPHSSQAHYTIPWFLRVPQVYFTASIILWGLVGLVIQLIHNRWTRIASLFRGHHHSGASVKGESL